jgi:phosphoribosyl 1,2-cyclic phosphodiesterase
MLKRMVCFTVLASGSKGNATVITGGRTRILVDAGLSCRELFRRMVSAGEAPETLDAIVVTHEHSDHVAGISVTARKLGIPVYFTEATHHAWMRWISPHRQMTRAQWMEKRREQAEAEAAAESAEDAVVQVAASAEENSSETSSTGSSARAHAPEKDPARLPAVEYFQAGEPFSIGDIEVSPFTTPHDAADPCGFVFRTEGVRLAYATDLGYMAPNVKSQLQGVDLLLLESNHDLDMLRDGPYPWQVKQRVLSRVGHLSNDAAASFLEQDYDGHAAYIVLGHLSESNNLPELARLAAEQALGGRMSLVDNHLLLASQQQPLDPIRF